MLRISFYIAFSLLALSLSAQSPRRNANTRQTSRTTTATRKQQAKPAPSKKQLQNEKSATQKARKEAAQQAAQLNKSIRTSLDSVLVLDNRIGRQQRSIDSLTSDITALQGQITVLDNRLDSLKSQLSDRKSNYSRALVYLQRHKSVQAKLMFVFSASNLEQGLRRMRYVREYSAFQKAQGEIIKQKQREVKTTQNELLEAKTQVETKRVAMQRQQQEMQVAKGHCQQQVDFLNKNLSTVQKQIKEYQQREAALDAQIERIIQAEIAEAKRRAEAEARRKAEEARRKAEAERIAREKRLAEAKAARERAEAERKRAEAAAAAAKDKAEKDAARAEAKRAAAAVKTAETEVKAAEKATAKAETTTWTNASDADAKLSSSFVANKGRLPMPITGSYSVVGHYGQYTVSGLRNVTLDNKGMDVRGQAGAQARAVFDGVVSQVFQYGGEYIVMLRHGSYISVYSGLSSVSVSKGAKVSTKQSLGAVGRNDDGNYVLHFQLRNQSSRLNPEQWVR